MNETESNGKQENFKSASNSLASTCFMFDFNNLFTNKNHLHNVVAVKITGVDDFES